MKYSTMLWREGLRLAVAAILASVALPGLAQRPATSLPGEDPALARTAAKAQGDIGVVVRFAQPAHLFDRLALEAIGATHLEPLPLIDGYAVRLRPQALDQLRNLPGVVHLSLDAEVERSDEFTVGASMADAVWRTYGLTGRGVGVAVIDSGVATASDLTRPGDDDDDDGDDDDDDDDDVSYRVVASRAFGFSSVKDSCGHGTHVAGIIAGNGKASSGRNYYRTFYGVAPEANIVGLRVLGTDGSGTMSDVIAAIDWCVANRWRYNIRVINLSLGKPVTESYATDPLCLAARRAWTAGMLVVCAAGNEGRLSGTRSAGVDNEGFGTAYGTIQSPANSPYVLTVGAMKRRTADRSLDTIATYSSRGPSLGDWVLKPDVVAPGEEIISINARDNYLFTQYRSTNEVPASEYMVRATSNNTQPYFRLSGTSMAAPVVSAAAALLFQANPRLSADTVKARIVMSADKWVGEDGEADPFTYGAGYLNIPAALLSTAVATGPALSPELSVTPEGEYEVDMSRAIWGPKGFFSAGGFDARAVWGNRAVWGPQPNKVTFRTTVGSMAVQGAPYAPFTRASSVNLNSIALQGERG